MKHRKIFPLLETYVEGWQDGERSKAVESHLEECRTCRKEVEKLERLNRAIHEHGRAFAEAHAGDWRKRIHGDDLPPQSIADSVRPRAPAGSFLDRLLGFVLRPAPALAVFFVGILAHQFMILPTARFAGLAARPMVLDGVPTPRLQVRDGQRSPGKVLEVFKAGTVLTFDLETPGRSYGCRLLRKGFQEPLANFSYRDLTVKELHFLIDTSNLEAGVYRMTCEEEPAPPEKTPLSAHFEINT